MRKLFTILLACIAFVSFAQRSEVFEDKSFGAQSTRVVLDNDTTLLWPGNSQADGNTFHIFWFGPDDGFLFGTNTYNDMAYGQEYVVDEPYNIIGATYWIARHAGTTGYVIFRVWDMADGTPGDVLHEQYVPMDELWGTTDLAEAYTIFFEDETGNPISIPVTDNYLIGVDISNLDDFDYDESLPEGQELIYGLGNVSTDLNTNQGGGNFLMWIQEDTGEWVNTENYGAAGWDADIMILVYTVPYDDDPGETFTVTFHVKDEDGEPIENATIVLGPFTNDEGYYVFEEVPEGTHQYTVTAPGFATVVDDVTVDDDMDVEVTMEPGVEYEVTFNVDMTDVEGFDPAEHHVFLTGNFTGWAEPGSEESLHMELVVPAKERTVETIFYENFDGGEIPEGWLNLDEDGDGNEWLIVTGPGHAAFDGDYAVMSQSWDADQGPLTPDNWLITPQLTGVAADWELSWAVKGQDPDWAEETYSVMVSFTTPEPGEFYPVFTETLEDGEWHEKSIALVDYDGEDIYIAFRHHDSTDMFQILIDAIEVTGTPGEDDNGDPDPDPEELIYTVTTQMLEGLAEYKYFSDAFGDGWAGEEWPGDPDREVMITADTTIDDVWGEYEPPVSVVEVEADKPLTLYPNPASSILNISADVKHLAVYDITGRMLIELHNTNMVNVSDLRNGLYIIQVTTPNGTEAHRFHVAK